MTLTDRWLELLIGLGRKPQRFGEEHLERLIRLTRYVVARSRRRPL